MAELMRSEDMPYRPCVGIMLLNPNGLIWLGRRIPDDEHHVVDSWQMPQGGIDENEDPKLAALRELEEEIGTRNVHIIGCVNEWLHYDLPRELVGKALKGRYRGQKQKWFAMKFLGQDSEIDINTVHPEFDGWEWVPPEEVLKRIIAFKRPVYEQVIAAFRPHMAAT
jgi:putative (di)nucleoside polyphosphate hydrolase